MTAPPVINTPIGYIAENFYKQLMSATRAKDVALYFFRREMEKQKATEADFRSVAIDYATHLVGRLGQPAKSSTSDSSDEELEALVRESIEYAKGRYEKK